MASNDLHDACLNFMDDNGADPSTLMILYEFADNRVRELEYFIMLAESKKDYSHAIELLKEQGVYLNFAQWAKNKLEGEDEQIS